MLKRPPTVKNLTVQALSVIQMPNSFQLSHETAGNPSRHDSEFMTENQIHFDIKENVEEQQEFSFSCNDQGTLKYADEIFENGKIRTTFAAFDQSIVFTNTYNNTLPLQPPLKKLIVVEQPNNFSPHSKGISKRSCNEASPEVTMDEVGASKGKCKKCKCSRFTKKWIFRENINYRSSSDGQDSKEEKFCSNKGKGENCKTTLSPREKVYVLSRKRIENSKQKSYLPYKPNFIGLFTNKNRLGKNNISP